MVDEDLKGKIILAIIVKLNELPKPLNEDFRLLKMKYEQYKAEGQREIHQYVQEMANDRSLNFW